MVARPNAALAQIHTQIMWSRLIAVVEEQAQTMLRTAFSTSVREAGDLSAGVFDRHGRMVAHATFSRRLSACDHETGRPLHHQRPVAHLGPSARHYRGDAKLLPGRSRRAIANTIHVVDIGGWSRELCGGTHVRRAGERVEVQYYIDNTGVQVADVVVGFRVLEEVPTTLHSQLGYIHDFRVEVASEADLRAGRLPRARAARRCPPAPAARCGSPATA